MSRLYSLPKFVKSIMREEKEMGSNFKFLFIGMVLISIVFCNLQGVFAQSAPYPPSPIITNIQFNDNIVRQASDCDNWPMTWGDDDNLYTAFGDGWGWAAGLSSKACLGTVRVSGGPTDFSGQNLAVVNSVNGSCHKATGILMIDGVLYLWARRDSGRLWKSFNRGQDWLDTGITMEQSDGSFHALHFCQFGKNYSGARDQYIYVYGTGNQGGAGDIFLFRVLKNELENKNSYEFYVGLDTNGNPIWNTDITQRVPIVSDASPRARDARIIYNAGINRYILTYTWYTDLTGAIAILDAPEPWGPWTTVFYTSQWDQGFTFEYNFPTKWISSDGKTMYMVFSGTGINDAFVVRKVTLSVAPQDVTAPTTPQSLNVTAQGENQIDLTWQAASDPESGISRYNIYRGGSNVGQSTTTSFSDTGLNEGVTYTYEVSAVNDVGLESTKSTSVYATTIADTTLPTITSVNVSGNPNQVIVVFSEPVEQASAENITNYNIDNAIVVSGALLDSDQKTVTITTSSHTDGVTYSLIVDNVKDLASTPNMIATNTMKSYTFVLQLVINNLTVSSGQTYETVQNGLQDGELVYIDRTYTHSSAPASVQGATYIKTANDDKLLSGSSFITFDVNQDATVYVAHDDRVTTKPSWMTSFTNTGDDLVIDSQGHSIWKKDFTAGTITLGGNEGGGNSSMYTVIVVGQGTNPTPDTTPPAPPMGLTIL